MRSSLVWSLAGLLLAYSAGHLSAKTVYVNAVTGVDTYDGLTAETPLLTLQAAVDLAENGDEVVAAPGTYGQGGRPASPSESYSDPVTNRVCIEKDLILRSTAGSSVTFIVGAPDAAAADGLGEAATRCIYATSSEASVVIDGFTLTNGFTAATADEWESKGQGGGARMNGDVTLTNCVLVGNAATMGGGAANGSLLNCRIVRNRAIQYGGGVYQCLVYNSLIVNNEALVGGGGGVYGTYYYCTIVGNRAAESCGGVQWYNQCFNTILYYNLAPQSPNYAGAWSLNNCCSWPFSSQSSSMISAEPLFANTNAWADLHLTQPSLCIDAGSSTYGTLPDTDFDGAPRVSGNQPDIGAYEWQGAVLPAVSLTSEQTTLTEDAGAWTLTLTASFAMTNDMSFALSYSGTATRNSDYMNAPDTVVISNGQTSVMFTLSVNDDSIPEHSETLSVTLVGNPAFRSGTLQQTATLLDNDGMPEITRFYLNNGSGGISTNVITEFDIETTNDPVEYVISEDPSFTGVSWVVHNEEDPFIFTLSEGYGEKTVWFKVRKPDGAGGYWVSDPVSDSIIYGPTLSVALDAPTLTFTTGGDTPCGTWFGFPLPTATNGACAHSASLPPDTTWINSWMETTFTLDQAMFLRFNYANIGNGGMELQIDGTYIYEPVFYGWTVGAHAFEQELAAGTHTVLWSASGGYYEEPVDSYSLVDAISFAIPPPRVWFVTNEQAIAENGGSATVFVRLEEPCAAPVTVTYAVSGTATATTDYTIAPLSGSVTFTPGNTRTNFTVMVINDSTPEHTEQAVFTLEDGAGYRIGTPDQHTLFILANDGLIDFYDLWLDNGAPETTNRVIRIDGDASETPSHVIVAENADFTGSDWAPFAENQFFTLSEALGLKTVYVKVRIPKEGGGWEESNVLSNSIRLVECTLSDALDTTAVVSTQDSAPWSGQRVTTHDGNDAGKSATLTPDQYASSEMTTLVQGPVKVSFWWKISSYSSYYYYNGSLNLLDNNTTIQSIQGIQDWTKVTYSVPEGPHTLTWQFYQNYYQDRENCGWVDQLSIQPDWPTVSFVTTAQTVSEDTGIVLIPVQLERVETQTLTVPYTLGGTATEGADYSVAPSGSVSFAPGTTTTNIAVNVTDDTLPERSETLILTLVPTNGVLVENEEPFIAKHTLTITRNDGAPAVTFFGLEGGGTNVTDRPIILTLGCDGSPTEYRLSQDPAYGDVAWQSYTTSPHFTLSEGIGVKTLWLQVRKPLDGGGSIESDSVSLTLLLQPTLAEALGLSPEYIASGSSSPWFGQTVVSRDGAAAQSGPIPHSGTTSSTLTLQGTGTVGFWWKVSSEGSFDYLTLYADGSFIKRISGTLDWTSVSQTFTGQGTHTLEWRYTKDGSAVSGSDCGWVDQVDLSGWVFESVATPSFSPESGKLFSESQQVTLTCSTPGAVIRYTLDNSEPTASSALYGSPFNLTETTTIKAKAFKTGYPDSATAQATFTQSHATPIFTPPSGTIFTNSLNVAITSAVATVSIRYTLDGTEPTTNSDLYVGPLTLTTNTTVKATAFDGETPASGTSTATYTLQDVAAPSFAPGSGLLFDGTCSVALACATSGTEIRYTLDESDPTVTNALYGSALTCTNAMTVIRARAFRSGMAPSAISRGVYFRRGGIKVWGYNGNGQCNVPSDLTNAIAVVSGANHSVALRTDGTVAAWGYNGYGQCNVPAGLSNAVALAAGDYHTVALKADGTITAWGYNGYGQCNVPAGLSNAVALAAGDYHTVVLKADGTVAAWGYNDYGQCTVPAEFSNAVAITAGDYHTVALKADGTVAAWGYNNYNQCTLPSGLSNVVAIAAGNYHSLALKTDGTITAWGYNGNGQGTVPADLTNAVDVIAGTYHNAALRGDGTVTAWGNNDYGQCTLPQDLAHVASLAAGANTTAVLFDNLTPIRATPPSDYWIPPGTGTLPIRLSAASGNGFIRYTLDNSEPTADSAIYNTAFLLADSVTLKARLFFGATPFGATLEARYYKQTATPLFTPATTEQFIPADGTLLVSISCEDAEAAIRYTLDGSEPTEASPLYSSPLALSQTTTINARAFKANLMPSAMISAVYAPRGTLYAWGDNSYGQCTPTNILDATAIAAGKHHSVVLRANGTVAVWGYNGYGQCTTPSDLTNVIAVAAGTYHTATLKANGTVTAWGNNGNGQCNVPADLSNAVALAAGYGHTAALRMNGTVAVWGDNSNGQCTTPADLSNAVTVAAGYYHTVALRTDGTVAAWGYNGYGQCTTPPGLSNVVAVAAGDYHTVALRADGTVTAWGKNNYGQCTVPAGLTQVIAITAGASHTVALTADGALYAWGYNDYQQCTVSRGWPRVTAIAAGANHTFVQFGIPAPVSATPPSGAWIAPGTGTLPVLLTAAHRAGTVRYTTNGTEPTASDTPYTEPLSLSAQTTLKARLFFGTEPSGSTLTALYYKRVAAPVATPSPASQFIPANGALTVALSSSENGAAIHYTLDGSEPTETSTAYITTLQVSQTTTLKARAFKTGLIPSATTVALYVRSGDLYAWGANNNGQLTIPSTLSNVVQSAASLNNSAALRANGTVSVWGYTGYAQCSVPSDLTNAVALALGYYHVLALRADGTVTAWGGYNNNGERDVPAGLLDVVAIAASQYNSAALKSDGTVTVWGYNGYSVCDPQVERTNAIAIALGQYHLTVLKSDGTVSAWGNNSSGQCTLPEGLSNVVALASGANHTVALKANGTVSAWGYNDYGQCTVPAGLSGVIAIAAGENHSVALKIDGTVVAWGYNNNQQCVIPAGFPRVASIVAGGNHTLVQFGLPSPSVFTPPSGMMVPGSGYPFPVRILGATLGGTFRYALDGSEPTDTSSAYTGPILLGDDTTVTVALFTNTLQIGTAATAHYPLLPGGVVYHTVTAEATPSTAGTATGGGTVRKNAALTVTATVTDPTKYVFGRWLRNGIAVSTLPTYTFTVTANSTMTAVFDLATYYVTATIEPYGLGWVYGSGWWTYGVTNTLTAYPYGGCRFIGWRDTTTGDSLGTNLTYRFATTNNLTVRALFEETVTSHTVTTRTEPADLIILAGAGSYTNGQRASFVAPSSITNDPLRYVFQYFKLNNGWGTSANPWNWNLSRSDPPTADICAVYTAQPLSPKVRYVSRNLDTPVPITDNVQTYIVFDRQMNPAIPPSVTVSNLAGTVVRTLPSTGTWTGWYVSGDTYRCTNFGFARGEDGDYVLTVSGARDTYNGVLAPTNAWSFRVDATPPAVPTLRLTSSNDTAFTVGWSEYVAPTDLNGFRVYVSESAFSNLASLSPVTYLWSGTRSHTRSGIQLDTTYWIAIVPMDQAGNMESAVTPLAVRIPRAIPPAVPFTVTATGADIARLDWPTYAGDALGFAEFRIYRDTAPFTTISNRVPIATVAKSLRTFTATGLNRTVTNWFSVVGFNTRGESIDHVISLPWTDPYRGVVTNNLTIGSNGTVTEILEPIIVREGAVLTVPAGATLAFYAGAGITIENGALNANGTALKPIRFTSAITNAPMAGSWNGIALLAQAGGSLLRHVWFEYGRGLTLDGCSPTVDACTARYNAPAGFSVVSGGTLATRDALLLYNVVAVRGLTGAHIGLTHSIVRNNATNAFAETGVSLVATNVWWGSAERATLQSGLSGAVTYEPFLTSEPVLTPAADAADGNRNVGVASIVLALAGRVAEAVQISEDSLFTGSFYDVYAALKTVTLSAGGGLKTLYIRFRNASGQVSETVTLPVNYITGGPQITGCNLAEGSTLTRPFVLTASAWSGLGLATLRVLADDTLVASTNTTSLHTRWDIRSLTPGTHRIKIEALDTRGNLGTRSFNVTANIQPPPNPVLTAPIDGLLTTDGSVAVAGTSEPFAPISLRRNGAVVQQVTANEYGAFAETVSLTEGENVLVATLTDTYGTGRSNERRVTRDSGAPNPIALGTPVYKPGSGLQIAWTFPADGESPSSIALLRSTNFFTTAAEAIWQGSWTTDNPLTTIPPNDGRWYFAAVGRDAANNQSVLSNVITNDYDGTAPAFSVTFDKASPCGLGLLRIELVATETLANLPTVTVQPPAASGPTMLTVSNAAPNRYVCEYNVQSVAGSGLLAVKVSGTDLVGNRATAVTPSGSIMVLDTRAPTGRLLLNPSGLIQVTNPVPLLASLTLDEQPAVAPTLRFTPPEGAQLPVTLTGSGTNWNGQIELLPSMGSGFGTFTLSVSDTLGNTGSQLNGATQVELYNTAQPEPPARVTDLRASTDQKAGVIKLAWLAVSDAESYTLYRQAEVTGTSPDQLVAENVTAAVYEDLPAADGFYRYTVTSTRRGAFAQPSPEALGLSDRTPPPTPQNLAAALSSTGVRVEWEYSTSGEQPEYFRVYRNGTLLRNRVTPATRFILDNPAAGTWIYAVSSVDQCGNEALSNSASIDMTLPAVIRTDVTVGTDRIPRLTWQTRTEHVGVNVYRNGTKLNATPLTATPFSDSELTGSGVTRYEVRGVNAQGTESAARQLPVHRLSFGLTINPDVSSSALLRYFDSCALIVSNRTTDAAFESAELTLTRTIVDGGSLTRTVQTAQTAAIGGAATLNVTLPCATASGVQSFVTTLKQALDDPSASVGYVAAFQGRTPSLTTSQIDVTLDSQPVAGAACIPRARIYNRSQLPLDIVMWRNGDVGDVSVRVLDVHETEVSRVDVMMPKASLIPTPDGLRGYLRIQPKDSVLLTLPEIIVPEALGADASAAIEVNLSHVYNACGETGEEISGPLQGRCAISPTPTAYTAFGTPERAAYRAGETMAITGYAFDRTTLARMTNVAVSVGISLNGTAWYTSAQTDAAGDFRAEWPILDGISGPCQVWASHPQVKDHLNQGQTAIYQAYFRPQEGSVRMAANDVLTLRLNAYNPGSFTFTNLTSTFTAWQVKNGVTNFLPLNVASGAVDRVAALALLPRQQVPIVLTLFATEEALPSFSCRFEIVTPEGLHIPFDASVSVTTPLPLITVATPASGYVDMSLDRGKTRSADIQLRNDGFKTLSGVKMTAPTVAWMQVALTPGTNGMYALPDIAPGESYTFQVLYAPDDAVEMKYYSDTLTITGTNTVTVKTVNLYAKVTSELRGRLAFHVINTLGQVVPNASVRVRSALDGTERTGFKTDENGDLDIPDLMEGNWHWQVSSSGHATQADTATVEADATTEVETTLTRELVTVTFTVVPVPFTDRYEIKIEQTFSTYVPAPVLVADPIFKDYGTVTGPFTDTYIVTAKNHGLIKLSDFTVTGSRASWGSLVPAISYLPELAPMQQIEIPFTMTFLGESSSATPSMAFQSAPMLFSSGITANGISLGDAIDFADSVNDTVNELTDVEAPPSSPPQFDPCKDDFFKAVKQLMAYLNGQYRCMSGSDLIKAQMALNCVVKMANSDAVPVSIGTFTKIYQAILCLADSLSSSSSSSSSSGGGGGGGGNGYGGGGNGCFAAGTAVLMADGSSRPIESIKPGDIVQSGPRAVDVSTVRATFCRPATPIRLLTLANGTKLYTTDEHRIWADASGWKIAKDIRPDDAVAGIHDTTFIVKQNEATPRSETVYTLDLKEDTAFYANGVLVQHLCGRQLPNLIPTHGTSRPTNGGVQ